MSAEQAQQQPSENDLYKEEKIKKINQCLEKPAVDLWRLRELALTEGGFINSEIRSRAWHKLISLDPFTLTEDKGRVFRGNRSELEAIRKDALHLSSPRRSASSAAKKKNASSKMKDDSSADCSSEHSSSTLSTTPNRSFDGGASSEWIDQGGDQNILASTIIVALSQRRGKTASEKPTTKLHYYHGFHNVASIVLYNYNGKPALASAVLRRVAKSHFRDAAQKDFSLLTSLLKLVFYPLLQAVDHEIHDYLKDSEIEPTVVLPWIISWFAVSIKDEEAASRLFDMYFASHPLMPLYTAVAMIVRSQSRQLILETDSDATIVKSVIRGLPSNVCVEKKGFSYDAEDSGITCQSLIDDSLTLMSKIPPRSLLRKAKTYDQGVPVSDLRCASSMSLLKAPASWAIAASTPSDQTLGERKRAFVGNQGKSKSKREPFAGPPVKVVEYLSPDKEAINTKARIASGVSLLMEGDHSTAQDKTMASPTNFVGAKSPPRVARSLVTTLFGRMMKNIKMTTRRKRFYASAE